jgi:hypothetical protein
MYSTLRLQSFRLCWFALSVAPLLAEAVAIGRSAVDSLDKRASPDCTVEGNSDLYGLGVRLGESQTPPPEHPSYQPANEPKANAINEIQQVYTRNG